jgi:ABC-type multidrug transport system ATPase subunit
VFSYVNQDEALMGTLTVEEQLTYSAQLRLPGSVPYSRIKEIVCTSSNIKNKKYKIVKLFNVKKIHYL